MGSYIDRYIDINTIIIAKRKRARAKERRRGWILIEDLNLTLSSLAETLFGLVYDFGRELETFLLLYDNELLRDHLVYERNKEII